MTIKSEKMAENNVSEHELELIEKNISKDMAKNELEEKKLNTLREINKSINYGDNHKNIDANIYRITNVDDNLKQTFEVIGKKAEKLGKQTSRLLKQVLKDRQTGGIQKGLYYGKKICPTSYSRHDKKYFQNNKLPTNSPKLKVALVVDESGSMSGDRITYARQMAITTYTFCKELDIDLMIIGHTTNGPKVIINQYVNFGGSFDNNDKYRLLNIKAQATNRDGYALKYAVEQLKKQDADMKLCIIVSDGQPNHYNYHQETAFNDLRNIKKDANKNNIDIIAAAIGDDKEIIHNIYGDCFLDISSLKKLPKTITSCIKKYLPTQ